jgi:hypothetical protein
MTSHCDTRELIIWREYSLICHSPILPDLGVKGDGIRQRGHEQRGGGDLEEEEADETLRRLTERVRV